MASNPRLRHGTIISRRDGEPLLAMVGSECIEIEVLEGSSDDLLGIKRYLNGQFSIAEIARRLGASEDDVEGVVAQFGAFGLLAEPTRRDSVKRDEFVGRVEETVTMWRRQMNCHPLFAALQLGHARQEVLDGLFIETYHFVRSAPQHIGTAIASATREDWRAQLAQYLSEERGHEALILTTLERLGYDPKVIRDSHPVIGTTSLINNLCACGRRSTLGYFLCLRLIEGEAATLEQAIAEMRTIAERYNLPVAAIDPIIRHATIDNAADHRRMLENALATMDAISAEEASIAVNCMHDLKHSFDQYYDQILAYYTNPTSYIPRLPIDYFCL